MNGGAVKRCFTFINTQEACALGKGGVSKTGDLKERLAVGKASVLVSVRDDVLCNRRIDACNAVQEGGGGGIEIDTDMVYGVLYSSIQCLPELLLTDIVLILSNADRLWIDLYELGERILHASCNGNGAANRDIVVGQFLLREL